MATGGLYNQGKQLSGKGMPPGDLYSVAPLAFHSYLILLTGTGDIAMVDTEGPLESENSWRDTRLPNRETQTTSIRGWFQWAGYSLTLEQHRYDMVWLGKWLTSSNGEHFPTKISPNLRCYLILARPRHHDKHGRTFAFVSGVDLWWTSSTTELLARRVAAPAAHWRPPESWVETSSEFTNND